MTSFKIPIRYTSIWKEAEPGGECECCGDEILIRAMQLYVSVAVGEANQFMDMPVEPSLKICCACHDCLE